MNDSDLKEEIMKVDYVGAGFLLIKKSALEKMEYPYFREYMTQHPFLENVQDTTSECVGFCVHAKKFNIPLIFYGESESEYGSPIAETNVSLRNKSYYASKNLAKILLAGCSLKYLNKNY